MCRGRFISSSQLLHEQPSHFRHHSTTYLEHGSRSKHIFIEWNPYSLMGASSKAEVNYSGTLSRYPLCFRNLSLYTMYAQGDDHQDSKRNTQQVHTVLS